MRYSDEGGQSEESADNHDEEHKETATTRKNKRLYNIRKQRLNKRPTREHASDDDNDESGSSDEEGDDSSSSSPSPKRQCTSEGIEHGAVEPEQSGSVARIEPSHYNEATYNTLDSEWGLELDSNVQKDSDYVPMMDPQIRQLRSLLTEGEKVVPESCFACKYTHNMQSIYYKDWEAVVKLYEASITASANYRSLGLSLYELFSKTIGEKLKSIKFVDKAAEFWSPYGILYHFLYHHRDVGRHLLHFFMQLNDMKELIISNDIRRFHPNSARQIIKEPKSLKIVGEMMLSVAKGIKTINPALITPSGASASIPDGESLEDMKRVYMPPGRALVDKPNFMPSHRFRQFAPT